MRPKERELLHRDLYTEPAMRTETTRKLPPFFTQVIGSLPRPKMVRSLHARRHQMSEERFRKVMDDMVLFAIRLQEEAGLDVVSDGEWRRVQYVDEFLLRIGGFEKIRPFEHGAPGPTSGAAWPPPCTAAVNRSQDPSSPNRRWPPSTCVPMTAWCWSGTVTGSSPWR